MVRLQNITWGFRVVVTLIFASFSFQTIAQNAPPPMPSVCSGTPPRATEEFGGNFDVTSTAGTLSNNVYCLGLTESSVDLTFSQNNPAAIGPFTVNVGYIKGVTNTSDLIGGYSPTTNYNFTEGYYWVAQTGTTGSGKTYHQCELISIFKPQPVTATVVTCGSSTVKVIIPSAAATPTNNHTKYTINWGDGSPVQTFDAPTGATPLEVSKFYTATSPIIVNGIYTDAAGNTVCIATQAVTKLPDPANNIYINKLEKNGTDYNLSFRGFVQNVEYRISYTEDNGSNVWTQAPDKYVNGNALVRDLDPTKNYCFKIAYVDNCGLSSESNIVCSITLNADVLSDTEVDLAWNKPTRPLGILQQNDLQKDEEGCSGCYAEPSLGSFTATDYLYNQLNCSSVFTFKIYNLFTIAIGGVSREVEIISNQIRIDPALNKPKPTFPAVVTNNDAATEVSFTIYPSSPKSKWNFYRSVGGSPNYTLIGTGPNNSFTDVNVNPDQEYYCYKYTYFDDCGFESAQSDAYCTVFLSSDKTNELKWTEYIVPNVDAVGNVVYTIEYIDANGNVNSVRRTEALTESVADLISTLNDPSVSFRIVATQVATLSNSAVFPFTSKSNTFTFNLPASAFIPSAFTPNGDGINDIFKPELRFVNSGSMIIYDRWGSIIFETTDLKNGWDGTEASGSRNAPVGTYTYKIQTLSDTGAPSFYTGTVTLIR